MGGNNRGDPLFIFSPFLTLTQPQERMHMGKETLWLLPHAYALCVGSGSKPMPSQKVEDIVFWFPGLWEVVLSRTLVISMSHFPVCRRALSRSGNSLLFLHLPL